MKYRIKRIIDILMTILLICLMSYQVTGEAMHEFIGIFMVMIVIIHQILNRKWYDLLFNGKQNLFRINITINVLLIISFVLTALSGIAMSNYAVPFLYNIINVNTARIMHLAFSYWSFMFMGFHIGMHMSIMLRKISHKLKNVLAILFIFIAGYGFYLLINSEIPNYMLFKIHFAFLDYEKNKLLACFENISILTFFVSTSYYISVLLKNRRNKEGGDEL